ncbi:MAG: M43 family zinc metalloprotease [Saprospiraceae bacterium]
MTVLAQQVGNERRKCLIRWGSLLVFTAVCLTQCTPPVTTRYLTEDEMGILPVAMDQSDVKKRPSGPCYEEDSYVYDTTYAQHYPMQYLRVNIHWMNSLDSANNVPESEAVAFAEKIIFAANYALENNRQMLLPNGNNTPVHPVNFRYVLTGRPNDPTDKGVYYHYDDSLFYYVHINRKHANLFSRAVFDKYGVQMDTVLNIFFMPHHPDSVARAGYAAERVGVALRNAVKVTGPWLPDFTNDKDSHWHYRGVFNHEIGHILGLIHAWTRGDGCDDTPIHANRCFSPGQAPGCDTMTSNNVMDYSYQQVAWTPCQIAKVHKRFADPQGIQHRF